MMTFLKKKLKKKQLKAPLMNTIFGYSIRASTDWRHDIYKDQDTIRIFTSNFDKSMKMKQCCSKMQNVKYNKTWQFLLNFRQNQAQFIQKEILNVKVEIMQLKRHLTFENGRYLPILSRIF